TSITIPKSVTSIGRYAFSSCKGLTSIIISEGVTDIGSRAFNRCASLTAVTFLGDAPRLGLNTFRGVTPTIYRKHEAKGWGDTFGKRPVKLISEKP
ncbi:leucine-rich repeat domain-containing protein, partial [Verrucomicrobia bacterium]|nr:leucine-rich repeat domain-containing protein [Verrucomicrobiota bacterium]